MEKLKMQTESKVDKNIQVIGKMFPNVLTETIKGYDSQGKAIIEQAIDFDLLKQELLNVVVEGNEERYQMNWPDKKKSILLANSPIDKTLRPCREESVDYDKTKNLYIEGDNLDVLKLLQETYLNRVKMIYIDPPYNIGTDRFVYNDNFNMDSEDFSNISGQYDEDGNIMFDIRQNNESNGRFHTDWLNMMYPRLKLAKDLLTEDGVIFISIDDNEVENLKKICNEVFGESCFIANAVWRSTDNSNNDAKQFSCDHNYTLIYSKSSNWQPAKISDITKRSHFKNPDNDPNGPYFDGNPLNSPNYRENLIYDIISPQGIAIKPPKNGWRWSKETLNEKIKSGEIRFTPDGTSIRRRTYLCNMKGLPPSSLWIDLEKTGHNRQAKYELLKIIPEDIFDTPKPVKLIRYILQLANVCNSDIILDFFSGSATTAHAVMQLNAEDRGNRKFIMVQLPEETNEKSEAFKAGFKNICEIGKERIRRAGKKIKEENPGKAESLDTGFRVLKLDSTNMKDVFYKPKEISQLSIDGFEENIKADRTPEDLLFQVMLELGELLSSDIEEKIIGGKKVFVVNGGNIIACFDTNITNEVVIEIAKLKPFYAVFRDTCMASDTVATNFEQTFETYSKSTIRKVL